MGETAAIRGAYGEVVGIDNRCVGRPSNPGDRTGAAVDGELAACVVRQIETH